MPADVLDEADHRERDAVGRRREQQQRDGREHAAAGEQRDGQEKKRPKTPFICIPSIRLAELTAT